jgi:hypothetical protein
VAWLLLELPEVTREEESEVLRLDEVVSVVVVVLTVVLEVLLSDVPVLEAVVDVLSADAAFAAIAPVAASEVASALPTTRARMRPTRRVSRLRRDASGSCSSIVVSLSAQEPPERPWAGPLLLGPASRPACGDWPRPWSSEPWSSVPWSSGAAKVSPVPFRAWLSSVVPLSAVPVAWMVAPIAIAAPSAPVAPATTTPRRTERVRRIWSARSVLSPGMVMSPDCDRCL